MSANIPKAVELSRTGNACFRQAHASNPPTYLVDELELDDLVDDVVGVLDVDGVVEEELRP